MSYTTLIRMLKFINFIMLRFCNIILVLVLFFICITFANSETKVYSWQSNDGNTTFSETPPTNGTEYEIIYISKPTVIDTQISQENKNIKDKATVNIKQSDIDKLNKLKLTADSQQASTKENNILNIQILYPVNQSNIFSKEQKIIIKTKPALTSEDKPIFKINDKIVPSEFIKDYWEISRPAAGENELSISGETKNGQQIISTNTPKFFIHNGSLQQSINTGHKNKAVYSL